MFKTLWNLIPLNIKIGLGGILIAIVLSVVGVYSYRSNKIESLENKLKICQIERLYEKDSYERQIREANETIETQNSAIEYFKINDELYQNIIKQKEKELLEIDKIKQEEIEKELQIDSSSENQLKIINKMLKEFGDNENP